MNNGYDFNRQLYKDEQILYQGKPIPGKGSKQIKEYIFVIGFFAISIGLLIWSLIAGEKPIDLSFIVIFIVAIIMFLIVIYGLVYNLFIKKRSVSDDYYCVTNNRVLKYESKKDRLVYGYLINYDAVRCENVKGNYGDLQIEVDLSKQAANMSPEQQVVLLKNIFSHGNPENAPFIRFESIENPRKVEYIVLQAINELKLGKTEEEIKSLRSSVEDYIKKN